MTSSVVYATAAQFRAIVGKSSDASDPVLLEILEAASRAIDEICNRPDGFVATAAAEAREYAGNGRDFMYIGECISITQVEVKDSPSDSTYVLWAAGDWIPFRGDPEDPEFGVTPYHGIMISASGDHAVFTDGLYIVRAGFSRDKESKRRVPTVKVTARWGYAADCPPQIYGATIAQAARWYKRYKGMFDDTVVSADLGSMSYKLRGEPLDNDVQAMLTRLIRPKAGVVR